LEAGSASVFRGMEGDKRRTPTLLGPLCRVGVLLPLHSPEDGSRASFQNTDFNIFNIVIFYCSDDGYSPWTYHHTIYMRISLCFKLCILVPGNGPWGLKYIAYTDYIIRSSLCMIVIQSTLVIPASVLMDFGYNRRFYHSSTVSLCFIIVTTWLQQPLIYGIFGHIGFLRHSRTVDFPQIYGFFYKILYSSQRFLCVWAQRAHLSHWHEDSILYPETPSRLVNCALCLDFLRTRSNH
jgi:hypothetical protein